MKVLYRISDNGYQKVKFANATKRDCLENFVAAWNRRGEIQLYVDKVVPETQAWIDQFCPLMDIPVIPIQGGSSAASWRVVMNEALALPQDEVVYFVEDDYLHLRGCREALLEAIERADYVTLYDAPDKYVPARLGGNPFIEDDGADPTKVILTKSRHWRLTNSTTMTFACKVKTLWEDKEVWDKWTSGDHPYDFQCFLELRERGRTLLSPIPSLSTHCEPRWAAPLIDWSKV